MAYSLVFILRQVNATKVCITSVCVFFQFFVYGLNVIDQILCLIYSNFKIFPKLTDTSLKWRHLWYLFYVRSMPPWFVLHPFVFFYSSFVFSLNVIDQILCLFCWNFKIFLNWRTHLQNGVIFGIYFTSGQCP